MELEESFRRQLILAMSRNITAFDEKKFPDSDHVERVYRIVDIIARVEEKRVLTRDLKFTLDVTKSIGELRDKRDFRLIVSYVSQLLGRSMSSSNPAFALMTAKLASMMSQVSEAMVDVDVINKMLTIIEEARVTLSDQLDVLSNPEK